ncbi:MAG: PstS family phosphate ABC transporter substrate-binding protein, partial [Nitrospiraceae bacterium]
ASGYAGIGFQTSYVRAVPLAEKAGQPFVAPSAAAAADETSPLHRPLYLYVNMDPKGTLDREEMEFLKFINSREGQQIVVKAGVYPLPAAHVAKNLQVLTGSPMAAAATGMPAVNCVFVATVNQPKRTGRGQAHLVRFVLPWSFLLDCVAREGASQLSEQES